MIREDLGKLYQEHYKTGLGVEVGVQYGYFSNEILKHWTGDLKCIDIWDNEEVYNQAHSLLGDRLLKGDSVNVSKTFKNSSLDFVYIDADHSYQSIVDDLNAWFPKVRNGGIVSGHDYVDYLDFGVIKAVDEFVAKHKLTLNLIGGDMSGDGLIDFKSWYFIK